MITTDTVLRRSIDGGGDDRVVTLAPAFSGLPDTAHGGVVLAAFDVVAAWAGARAVAGHYHRRVPLGVPLSLRLARAGGAVSLQLLDAAATLLVDGRVEPLSALADDVQAVPSAVEAAAGAPLPVSRTCFVCGIDNALGLQARLAFDAHAVWTTWPPDDRLRGGDGALAPVALTGLLDETAFWLGALATGESGMTTELRVALHGPIEGPVTVRGERAAVRQRADDPRYWETRVEARDARGRLVAGGAITFVAVRGAARRLVSWMAGVNPRAVVQSVFPAYTR